ncbi:MAG: hypothetical protein IJ003_06645 [Candidatus Gastranaerophilales bacterium]|nr:hypothetical protein [Candidatus Gastranaerophilales bacterium]
MNKELEKTFELRYSELDCNLNLKPYALFHHLQDIASDSAEKLDFGYSYISKKNLAWYLLKYRIEFYDYPKNAQEITLKTAPRGYLKLFAFRDFEIIKNEKTIAKIASTWALIDKNTGAIVSIANAIPDNPYMSTFQKQENDLSYQKIPAIENVTLEKTFEIRFEDIDVNKHVNNSNYILWALETLDFNSRTREIKTIDVNYKKEITYGQKVVSQVEIKDNITNHVLKCEATDEILCNILIQWQ